MTYQIERVLNIKCTLGEGPHWDHRQQVLYWVDIMEKRFYIYDPLKNKSTIHQFDQFIGSVVPGQDNDLIMAMQNGIYTYDLHTKELRKVADPEAKKPNNRFNDGKCDPSGRYWAGTMSLNGEEGCGSLYRLDTNGEIRTMVSNVSISNGLSWSKDKKHMYFIDTPTRKVAIYKYDDKTGDISFHKYGVNIPSEMGSPDGMTIDNEGMIWVAHWGGSRVTRWNPHSGELLDQVHVPAKNVTSCTFGGENLDELYITTASTGTNEQDAQKYPESGGLFKVKTQVKGVYANHFSGLS